MRKFKLIKEYPGSGAVGTISQPNDLLQHDFFEKYSEYWQEMKESDYQIISFSASMWGKGALATLQEDGTYSTSGGFHGWPLREMLEVGNSVKNGMVQIHSVKRISDGEIFTIGDRAKTITSKGSHTITQFRIRQYCTGKSSDGYTYDGVDRIWIDWEKDCGGNWLEFTEKIIERDFEILNEIAKYDPKNDYKQAGSRITSIKRLSDGEIFTVGDKFKANIGGSDVVRTIKSIKVDGDIVKIYQENGDLSNRKGSGIFHQIKKVKQPIFLTHDGKDIFEGDRVIWVNKDSLHYDTFTATSQVKFHSDLNAYFLSAVDAQNYIKKNTPVYITEDGVKVYDYNTQQYWVINGKYEYRLAVNEANTKLVKDRPNTYKLFSTKQAAEEYVEKNKVLFTTEDGVEVKKDQVVYVLDGQLNSVDMIVNFVPKDYPTRKAFSTAKAAENYIVQHKYALSIEDFWDFASNPVSNFVKQKQLKRLVKERLNIQ